MYEMDLVLRDFQEHLNRNNLRILMQRTQQSCNDYTHSMISAVSTNRLQKAEPVLMIFRKSGKDLSEKGCGINGIQGHLIGSI